MNFNDAVDVVDALLQTADGSAPVRSRSEVLEFAMDYNRRYTKALRAFDDGLVGNSRSANGQSRRTDTTDESANI